MSYEVLARKWRPQDFDSVVGQDHITRTLKKAVESSRLAHAYIFSGPRGCGKTSTARILAKVINCTDLKDGNPCDKCPSCIGVLEGNNLDVMEIDGASHTGVGEVRDLQESIGYAASQFQNKVYIIDEVHMLSTHAFNALLKTLEEPPSHVYFIFATTAPHKIPDTIKSRCQRHQFKRLEIVEISDHLEKICKAEKVKTGKDALRLLARKAEGSMRDAESLLDQVITASSGKVDTASVRTALGLLDQAMVLEFLSTLADGDSTAVLKKLDDAVQQGVDLEELLNALIEGFRDVMLLATPGDLSDLIYRSAEEIDALRELLDRYELADAVTIVERLSNSAPRLKIASDPRILLESVLVDIALLERQQDLRELINRIGGGGAIASNSTAAAPAKATSSRKPLAGSAQHVPSFTTEAPTGLESETRPAPAPKPAAAAPAPAPAASAPAPAAPAPTPAPGPVGDDVDFDTLDYASAKRLWDGFATFVRQRKLSLGVCLLSGTLGSLDDHTATVRFAKGFNYQKEQVEHAANKKFLVTMMKKYFGRDLELVCFTEGDEKVAERQKQKNKHEAGAEPSGATTPLESKPLVKKILTDFDGEIVRYHPQQ